MFNNICILDFVPAKNVLQNSSYHYLGVVINPHSPPHADNQTLKGNHLLGTGDKGIRLNGSPLSFDGYSKHFAMGTTLSGWLLPLVLTWDEAV